MKQRRTVVTANAGRKRRFCGARRSPAGSRAAAL